jgi:Tol biopolymer transport system component/tRNA A-37 threonylcarbamoyl transferase component Bud32
MSPELFRQIEELYHSAREATADARAALLGQADPEVRREVELLLRHRNGGEFLNRPAILNAPQMLEDETVTVTELASGACLGPYRIESKLGEGGMGEVFRAVDTRLGRAVAIKTTREQFNERFEREARTISSLNHPHICTLFDVGPNYLVMELVEGETIAQLLKQGPMPVEMVCHYGLQIAAALVEAHGKGIVHRDLKPGNVMIARSGVKVLDFGLAKSGQDETVTGSHMVVGTPAYMSPEQKEGKPADARSDIYSFGCLLHEMSTGSRVSTERKRITSPKLERIVSRCLEADPARRWQSAAELERELAGVTATGSRGKRVLAAGSGAAALAMVGFAGWYFGAPKRPVTSPSEYIQITDFSDSASAPALSPDGRMVTFLRGGNPFLTTEQIYVKLLPDGQSMQVTHDPLEKYNPVFTPDGSRVAYTTMDRDANSWDTWTVPVTGGSPTRLMRNAAGLTWIGNGRILFSEVMSGTALHMGIVTSNETRAGERQIYFPEQQRAMAHYSLLSPDQKSILAVEMDPAWLPCRLLPMDGTSKGRRVGPPGACTAAAWSPDGNWMYFNAESDGATHLWRQRFPNGVPEQITTGPSEEQGLAMAPDGKSLISSVGIRKSSVWIHDATGEHSLSPEGSATSPKFSGDGKRVYYLLRKNSSDANELWLTERASGTSSSALPGVALVDFDISRDGQQVAFTSSNGSNFEIFIAPLDGSAPPRSVVLGGDNVSFGRAGELIFRQLGSHVRYLARVKTDGTGLTRIVDKPLRDDTFLSPDGKWAPDAGGHGTVAVSLKDGTRKVICANLCVLRWSPDGAYLFVTLNVTPTQAHPTLVFPIPPGAILPDLPALGLGPHAGEELPKIRKIFQDFPSFGPDPQTYAFVKSEFVSNLFRIPLH